MSDDSRSVRDSDSNSLLRMYDSATAILSKTNSQLERARADKLIQRIAKELQRRNVRF
jgi:flagellar motor protein MotB